MTIAFPAPETEAPKRRPEADPERWRCAWSDGRERCHYPGSMSHGTRGEGPWHCRFHFFCGDAVTGQRFIEASRDYRRGDQPPAEYQVPAELAQEEPGSEG